MLVHADDLRAGHEHELRMLIQQRLHRAGQPDDRDFDAHLISGLGRALKHLLRRVVAAHGVDGDSQLTTAYMSRFRTVLACAWMNFLRGSTSGPISFSNISLAAAASSTCTRRSTRVSGFMVVSHSSLAFISPSPFMRWTSAFLPSCFSARSRSPSDRHHTTCLPFDTLSRRAFSTFRILPRIGRMAWNFRSRPPFAVPPADSPSTM